VKLSNFIEGLKILQRYFEGEDGHRLDAKHDQFYVDKTDRPLSDDDVQKLRGLGWFQPESEENSTYDPEKDWSAFP
jgi:hypothetical protein